MSIFGFEILLGAAGHWSFQAEESFTPSASQWKIHPNNSYLHPSSNISFSNIVQEDGSLKLPYTGLYNIKLGLKGTIFNDYISRLKGCLIYKAAKANSYNTAEICNTVLEGMQLELIQSSCSMMLNKEDKLIPTFTASENLNWDFKDITCYCNTISIVYVGRDRPYSLYYNSAIISGETALLPIINRSSFPYQLTLSHRIEAEEGETDVTIHLTDDKTPNGKPLFKFLCGYPIISVYHKSKIVPIPCISDCTNTQITLKSQSNLPKDCVIQFLINGE